MIMSMIVAAAAMLAVLVTPAVIVVTMTMMMTIVVVMIVAVMAGMIMTMLAIMRIIMVMMIMGRCVTMAVVMVVTVMIVAVMCVTRVMVTTLGKRRRRAGIGAAFRIERRLDFDDASAKPQDHFGDDVIAADAQTARRDLGRQVAVAEMPGDPHQMLWIRAADLEQRFGGGDNLDQPAILQHQGVAPAECHGLVEIEQKREPAGPLHGKAPPVPIVEPEHDAVGRLSCPTGAEHPYRADHGCLPTLLVTARRPWPA